MLAGAMFDYVLVGLVMGCGKFDPVRGAGRKLGSVDGGGTAFSCGVSGGWRALRFSGV